MEIFSGLAKSTGHPSTLLKIPKYEHMNIKFRCMRGKGEGPGIHFYG